MPKSLVIVESPTKARTIAKFLDAGYVVESSIGHVRDLPESAKEIPAKFKDQKWSRLGIDVENGFRPLYVVPSTKKKQVDKLKALLKDADALYLATDEDREGESISWHLKEVLQPKVPIRRLVFHEITREAIRHALDTPRDIDDRLVTAQEVRRVLDRLYGYEISPLLWRKIAPQLSAGRVQSVALRVIVERERERMAFRRATWWDLSGQFAAQGGNGGNAPFGADLVSVGAQRVASGRDFDPATGKLKDGSDVLHLDEEKARALAARLQEAAWQVAAVERKPYTSRPPAPFVTSTLQQEANRKLRWGSRDTMRVAQALYEKGFITYMRTDSTTLSDQALNAARTQVSELYGADYLPPAAREYKSRVKNAQEAHEAIRPAGDSFRLPDAVKGELDDREARLYEMIWKRTMASQMADARGHRVSVQVRGQAAGEEALFQANGRTIDFPGYLRAYVEGSDDPAAELGDQEKVLPDVREGQELACQTLESGEHSTQPPARYTEASLIKELEAEGIGRPSTYAAIIDTVLRRNYVVKKSNALVPSFMGIAVVQLMEAHFTHLVDPGFTAKMEDSLDAISRGERDSRPYLEAFYFGGEGLPGLVELLKAEIDPRQACTIPLPGQEQNGSPINVRIGKYGPYLERETERASLPQDLTPDELTLERAEDLLKRGAQPDELGSDPKTGKTVYLKNGRYGPYVQLGEQGEEPKMKSLLPGQSPETLTLEDALQVLSLPREVGVDPVTEEPIVADLGRYGPYLRRGKDTRSLGTPAQLFSISLAEARDLFLQEKSMRRGGATLIRALGTHPDSGDEVNLMSGRFGPYVTDGSLNASVPRATNPDTVDLTAAVDLLKAREAKGAVRKPARKPAAKSAASKAGAKKSTTRKAPAKKAAAKKKPAASKTGGSTGKRGSSAAAE